MADARSPVHGVAIAVAVDPDGPLAGVLLRGRSGSGKSALALSLIENCPWRRTALVADDAVLLREVGGSLIASSPAPIEGQIEIRGFGLCSVRTRKDISLLAGFDLSADGPRLPEPVLFTPENLQLTLEIWPFKQSAEAVERIRPILRSILGGQTK